MLYPERYLVTAALPYANGPLHIGHMAGCYLNADIYVRFLRHSGKEVSFICGSDEHGAAITIKALKEGKSPGEIVDYYHEEFKKTFKAFNISFDYYHRTSSELHHKTAADFFRILYAKESFEEKETEQYYDPEAEQFLADRYIKGTCPKCDYEDAYGDQCERCGTSLSPTELIDPVSTLSNARPVLRKTTHWYLPLEQHEDWLQEWIEKGILNGKQHHDPEKWKNHVLGQCRSWLEQGLKSRAMTRDLDWGVEVPREISGSDNKKLYVWMDAPIGYISSTKAWAEETGRSWEEYWKDDKTALIHFIGKDNIVFHCIIFPAILKEHEGFILPVNVPANQFLNLEGDKISTSRNWAVWVNDFVEEYPEYVDSMRYYLTRIMPEARDSEFTWSGFQEAHDHELVNNLSNFIHRVLSLTDKYFDGKLPETDHSSPLASADEEHFTFYDVELIDLFDIVDEFADFLRNFEFRQALKKILELSSRGNQFLQNNAPWKVVKSDKNKAALILETGLQMVGALQIMLDPFMPGASERLVSTLHIKKENLMDLLNKLSLGEAVIEKSYSINDPQHLFSRLPDNFVKEQMEKLKKSSVEKKAEGIKVVKSECNFEDFLKMDLRAGTIEKAERMDNADKLLKLQVNTGNDVREVVSGIAEFFDPDALTGQRVVILVNLAPKKLRGVMSHGMIMMSEGSGGTLKFVHPGDVPDGSVIS